MTLFRLLLAAVIATVGIYTVIVATEHGMNFLPYYFADIMKMGWPGQFNIDFTAMLTLASAWLMWRHHFSAPGLFFGLIIFIGGALFLCTYLLVASFKADGNVKVLMLGEKRASIS